MRGWPFALAVGALAGFAWGNGLFARALSAGSLQASHWTPGTPRYCGGNWAFLLGGFSSNSAYDPADNGADRSCYAANRRSGDGTRGLFCYERDFDVFGRGVFFFPLWILRHNRRTAYPIFLGLHLLNSEEDLTVAILKSMAILP